MMKKNSRLYQHLFILLALGNTSFVLASDNEAVEEKGQTTAMPAAPSGPYRSQIADDSKSGKKLMLAPQFVQPPLQQPVPNWVKNRSAPPAWVNKSQQVPNWVKNRPAPPAWVNRAPQVPNWVKNRPAPPTWVNKSRQVPNWVRNRPAPPAWVNRAPQVPNWVKNPPAPPAWVTNRPRQPLYRYGNPSRNY